MLRMVIWSIPLMMALVWPVSGQQTEQRAEEHAAINAESAALFARMQTQAALENKAVLDAHMAAQKAKLGRDAP